MSKQTLQLKDLVREKYGSIAMQSPSQNASSCCGATSCCNDTTYTVFSENYENLKGYEPDADMGLGCGIPTEYAGIQKGHHILDLGCGAGNDCFIARTLVGESGKVTGLDFTDEMILKARANLQKTIYTNIEFVKGDIEEMPFDHNQFDVIISNCVLNLVPDKTKAFSEIFRVLKSEGQFCISDVVLSGKLPDLLKTDATMYAGCIAGAMDKEEYIQIIKDIGFLDIIIHKLRKIEIPVEIIGQYLSESEMGAFIQGSTGIFSITISAKKP